MYPLSSRPLQRHCPIAFEALEARCLLSATPLPAADDGDVNDQLAEAIDMGLITGVQESENTSIDPSIDVDMFRFDVTAGQRVSFDIDRPAGTLDSYIRLFNGNGVQIASNDDGVGPGEDDTYESFLDYTFTAAGTYYVGVSGYGNSSYDAVTGGGDSTGGTGEYTLVVTPGETLDDDAYEDNDAVWQARHLGNPATRRTFWGLKLTDSGDWFRFRTRGVGSADDYVRIDFTSDQGDLELELYNSARQLINRSIGVGNTEQLSLENLPAGQVFIRVYGYEGARNDYNLVIEPAGDAAPTSTDDAFEHNDSRAAARNLGVITAARTVSDLVMLDSNDWYRFRMNGVGTADDFLRIDFSHARGDLDLELYNAAGQLVNKSISVSDFERIPLERLAGGEYFVRVFGFDGAANPAYSLTIDPAGGAAPPVETDDNRENNDTRAAASNVGFLLSTLTIDNLVMADTADHYRFRVSGVGGADDFVRIAFDHARGDLDLALLNAAGGVVRSSVGATGAEQVSLQGLPAGTYTIRVIGYNGASNPDYSLTITPPAAAPEPTPTGRNVLYVNFDGISITNNNLRDWAGTDWQSSIGDYLDPEGDGIRVDRFFAARGDRNQIISGIIARLEADLQPFGITVQRVTTGAVVDQGATTLFFGTHNMRDVPHVASDVDYGNDNTNDIAFIKDEQWGSTADIITAMSDVALHEAGHTFGLFHVNIVQSGTIYSESMGLRYSVDQDHWLRDTSFLNRTFNEYLNHGGGRGSQNTVATMRRNFGLAAGNPTLSKAKASYKDTRLVLLECIEEEHDEDENTLREVEVRRGRLPSTVTSARRG